MRAVAMLLLLLGAVSLFALAWMKLEDGSIREMLKDKFGTLSGDAATTAPTPPAETPDTDTDKGSSGDGTGAGDVTERPNDEDTGAIEPPSEIPLGAIAIVPAVIPESAPRIENQTGRGFDVEYVESQKSGVIPIGGSGPVCLILHTHTSEGFLPEGSTYFDPSFELARTKNKEESVVALGEILAQVLNGAGIPTVHSSDVHDEKSAGTAYTSSARTVAYYLAKYPTIKYVFDVHRSVITDSSGALVDDSVLLSGSPHARIRLTVSGGASLSCASVESDLCLALRLSSLLSEFSPSVVHPVLVADAVYNADLAPRTLKIDIGSCASTLESAKESARLMGEAIAALLKS